MEAGATRFSIACWALSFFDVDPDTGRVREFNEEFGHEAKRNYL